MAKVPGVSFAIERIATNGKNRRCGIGGGGVRNPHPAVWCSVARGAPLGLAA